MAQTSRLEVVKRGSVIVASLAVVLAVGAYLQTVIRIDPFAGLKQANKDLDPNVGVRLEGVTLKSYQGNKLVTKAEMDRLDIRQDRQFYDLFGVRNGVFYSNKGQLGFDSSHAKWNVGAHQLEAPQGGHVVTKDANLKLSQFVFKSDENTLHVPGPVNGKLVKGDVTAQGLRYNIDSGAIRTGPIHWKGPLALNLQGQDQSKPTTWDIKSDGDFYQKAPGVYVFEKGYGTDGDVFIVADLVEHDRNTNIVTATGHVRYVSSKAVVVCDKAVIYRKTGVKKADLTGNVQMLIKAKESQATKASKDEEIPPYRPIVPDEIVKSRPEAQQQGESEEQKKIDDMIRSGKNIRQFPTICYADRIEYWYGEKDRHAIITGHPQARQELPDGQWRQIWTNVGYYDGEKDLLKLVSTSEEKLDTRMINSLGDDLTGHWVEVSTADGGEDHLRGHLMQGTLMDYGNEFPKDKKPLPVIPPTTGGNGGTGGTGGTGGGTKSGGKSNLKGPVGKSDKKG